MVTGEAKRTTFVLPCFILQDSTEVKCTLFLESFSFCRSLFVARISKERYRYNLSHIYINVPKEVICRRVVERAMKPKP